MFSGRNVHYSEGGLHGRGGEKTGPCKTCSAFKEWTKSQSDTTSATEKEQPRGNDCPLDKNELGNNTWSFLHTMAAYYPDNPTDQQKSDMKTFFKTFSNFYPCDVCASHLRNDLEKTPPDVTSSMTLSKWLCQVHNRVNVRLEKSEFDCSRVMERWRDGWKDGSCD